MKNRPARLTFAVGILAASLAILPFLVMGGAGLARMFGNDRLRNSLAVAAFYSQAVFCWINWFLLSPVICVSSVVAIVWSMRRGIKGIGLAAASIALALIADAICYYSVNYWAR